jgi:hypothetical protein
MIAGANPKLGTAGTGSGIMNTAIGIALGAVTLVLFFGLANMLRGGNSNRSQMLMRWRVGLQFLAIAAMVATMWYRGL